MIYGNVFAALIKIAGLLMNMINFDFPEGGKASSSSCRRIFGKSVRYCNEI